MDGNGNLVIADSRRHSPATDDGDGFVMRPLARNANPQGPLPAAGFEDAVRIDDPRQVPLPDDVGSGILQPRSGS